jgi:hypothetical protein
MYPATEIDLHLTHVCAAQRRALTTVRAAFRALYIRHNLLPPPRSPGEAPAAVQISGKTSAVGNAEESSRPPPAPAEIADDGRRPTWT